MTRALLSLACLASLAACAKPPAAPPPPREVLEYRLDYGDLLEVKVYGMSEFDQEVQVRPDGRISFSPVGEIDAVGRTPAEIDAELTSALAQDFGAPEATVFVKKFVNQNVYVGGEVDKAGIVPIQDTMTSLMAIVRAGGFLDTAQVSNVVVLRDGESGREVHTVDARRVIAGEAPDLVLAPYDVVYVPRSIISRVDLFVDQYIRRVLPMTLMGGANYNYVNDNLKQDSAPAVVTQPSTP
jgi:protein involved in polysaccharide export with SLBB domain